MTDRMSGSRHGALRVHRGQRCPSARGLLLSFLNFLNSWAPSTADSAEHTPQPFPLPWALCKGPLLHRGGRKQAYSCSYGKRRAGWGCYSSFISLKNVTMAQSTSVQSHLVSVQIAGLPLVTHSCGLWESVNKTEFEWPAWVPHGLLSWLNPKLFLLTAVSSNPCLTLWAKRY